MCACLRPCVHSFYGGKNDRFFITQKYLFFMLDEMSPREFLTYVLKELSLEERDSLMIDEKQRRKTFLINWPHDNQMSSVRMAQAGFYCVGKRSSVKSSYCIVNS